ncbi:hypothetical protein AB0G49_24890, partial [Streptomyces longwoodensis]|uniref:hypothetical protein n=1 Tax=Streptomyces longwoodensis TaxID=68231 RepID=UPI0033C73148
MTNTTDPDQADRALKARHRAMWAQGVSRGSCRARGAWHRTSPRCRRSPMLRIDSLLRLAMHG